MPFGEPRIGVFSMQIGFCQFKQLSRCRLLADIVAKRVFASRRATLIQKIDLPRKIDSSGAHIGFESCAVGGGRRLLQQNRHKADNPTAPAIVSFWTKANKGGFWPEMVCPLSTRTGHARSLPTTDRLRGHRCSLTASCRYDMLVAPRRGERLPWHAPNCGGEVNRRIRADQ